MTSPSDENSRPRRALDESVTDAATADTPSGSTSNRQAPAQPGARAGHTDPVPAAQRGGTFGSTPTGTAEVDAQVAAYEAFRARKFRGALTRTLISTIAPGTGFIGTRADRLGKIMLAIILIVGIAGAFIVLGDPLATAGAALQSGTMMIIAVALMVVMAVWVTLILGTYLIARPRRVSRRQRIGGSVAVGLLSLVIALPMTIASAYAYQTSRLSGNIFQSQNDTQSQTRPTLAADPWADLERVNILLLGGDSGEGRDADLGIRTDTMMVASIDTRTGATLIIQLPRSLQYPIFPDGNDLQAAYPYGFDDGAESFLSSVWHVVPTEHPELFTNTDYAGADALKYAVQGVTGLKMDYFLLVNIDGLVQLIDAMGGVTVNVNYPLAKGGSTEYGCGQDGWIPEGPDQHLNGTDAMWYARSRCNSSRGDADRMARQSCLVNAVINQADPANMLVRYEAIAQAAGNMISTDIPAEDLSAMADLAGRVQKGNSIRRLTFVHEVNGFYADSPDFDLMHQQVAEAIDSMAATPSTEPAPTAETTTQAEPTDPATGTTDEQTSEPSATSVAETVVDACAYRHEEPASNVVVPTTVPVYTPPASTEPTAASTER